MATLEFECPYCSELFAAEEDIDFVKANHTCPDCGAVYEDDELDEFLVNDESESRDAIDLNDDGDDDDDDEDDDPMDGLTEEANPFESNVAGDVEDEA